VLLALAVVPAAAGITKVDGGIEFTYTDPSAGSVSLAGIFNSWSMNANPLTMDENGVWRVVVALGPGTYEYKFVVNGSEWVADPESPKVAGSYGNSEITIDANGEPVIGEATGGISNTAANARVNVNGWYRATYDTRSDVPEDPRWRLSRPAHDIYVSVNPTVTPQITGSATLRFNTGVGDITQVAADLYSGHAKLEGEPFTVTGFYNEEDLEFDDPLETVGHADLKGTIAEEHIPFGRGSQGAMLETKLLGASLTAAYANAYDADIWNNPSIYDNTDTDLIAGRLKRAVGPVTLGATYTAHEDGWWISFLGTNQSPQLTEYKAESGSTSDWFELANSERVTGVDAAWQAVPGWLGLAGEYAGYSYKSRWDMGNQEKIEGTAYSNGAIDVPVAEANGWLGKIIVTGAATPVTLRFEAIRRAIDGMSPGDEVTSFEAPIWADGAIRQYTDVRGAGSLLAVNVYGPAPERADWETESDVGIKFGIFDLLLEYDRDSYEWTYPESLAAIGGTKWQGTVARFATHTKADIMGDELWVALETEGIGHDTDAGLWDVLDTEELVFRGGAPLYKDWGVLLDVRYVTYVTYKDVPDGTGASDESFWNPYLALVYTPRENVELRIGYGVNPTGYVDTPIEGRGNGRERWRAEYMWDHGAASAIDAERALEDARTIGLMAVISY
jgi:hypothetical protein